MDNFTAYGFTLSPDEIKIIDKLATERRYKRSMAIRLIIREWAELTNRIPPTPQEESQCVALSEYRSCNT